MVYLLSSPFKKTLCFFVHVSVELYCSARIKLLLLVCIVDYLGKDVKMTLSFAVC